MTRNLSKKNKRSDKNVVVSWTGGKDGCYACYRAMEEGYRVTHLLHFADTKKRGSHALNPGVIAAQAASAGIPLIRRDFISYEQEFKNVILALRRMGARVDGAVFGHIQTHGGLVERICHDLSIETVMPLWKRDPESLLREMMDAGLEMVIVSARGDVMGKEWLGRTIDGGFPEAIRRLPVHVDPCGENGEFHTLVTDCPFFGRKIRITDYDHVFHEGYWFLDIREFSVQEKK